MLTAIVALTWAVLFFRLICFRTTMSPRTILTWLVLGALLGTVAIPAAYKFFDYYRFTGTPSYLMLALILELLMMTFPVLVLVGRPSLRCASSICDAFLAAFSIGIGYEFLGLILAAAQSEVREFRSLSYFPPGIVSSDQLTVAGFGYWCGFVTLLVAAAMRFLKKPVLVYTTATGALVLCALDMYGDLWRTPFAEQIRTVTVHGSVVPWLTVACLIVGVVLENRWLKTRIDLGQLQAEFLGVGSSASRLKFRAADQVGQRYRLRRQSENLAGEFQRDANNTSLRQQSEAVAELALRETTSDTDSAPLLGWRYWIERRWAQLFALLCFLLLAGLLPDALGLVSFSRWLWKSQLFAGSFPPFATNVVSTIVVLVLVWHYVEAPPRPFSKGVVDEVGQFSAEHRILQVGFSISLLVVLYPQPKELIDFQSTLAKALNMQPVSEGDVKTLLLLLAWAAIGLTVRRAEIWRAAGSTERLRSLLHNLVTAFSVGSVAWLILAFYIPAQEFTYAKWGPWAFEKFSNNGNSVLGMLLGLVTAAVSFLAAWVAQLMATRFERSVQGPGQIATTAALSNLSALHETSKP